MIIATGSCSKKFGDICYSFVIFIINISDFLEERLITRLDGKNNYKLYFFLTVVCSCILHLICVFTLVGKRILIIEKNRKFDLLSSKGSHTTEEISQFVAARSRIKSMSVNKMNIMSYNNNDDTTTCKTSITQVNSQSRADSNETIYKTGKNIV